MLITFEGIDGSGKSTQIELLKEALMRAEYPVKVFREPGGTDLSEMVRGILLNADVEIDPVTEVLLFSSSRSQLIAEKVIPLLEKEYVIILDRFYDSTVAYQGYGRESMPIEQIHQINRIASHGVVPDVTLYLKLTWEQSAERTAHLQKDRIEKEGEVFFKKVNHGFEMLMQSDSRFKIIEAYGAVERVHARILKVLKPYLERL